MKTLTLIIVSLLSISLISNATKRVPIKKVIEAIEDDPEEAIKTYNQFNSRFDVVPDEGSFNGEAGVVRGTEQRYKAGHLKVSLEAGKKYLFRCKLQKYKSTAGKEKVRIYIEKILK